MQNSNGSFRPPPAVRTGRPPPHPGSREHSQNGAAPPPNTGGPAPGWAAPAAHTAAPHAPHEAVLTMNPMYPVPSYGTDSPNGHASSPRLYGSPRAGTVAHVRPRGFTSSGGGGGPTKGGHLVSYGVRKPLRKDASWWAVLVLLAYLGSLGFYLYVRIIWALDAPGASKGYSIFILVVELLGVSSVLPYAIMNVAHTHPTGSPGLPEDDGVSDPEKKFRLRILIPCYKEGWGVVGATARKALEARLPPGVERTVYICDDGASADTRARAEALNAECGGGDTVVYVTGRKKEKGQINGKSLNLNHCLTTRIYEQYASNPGAIPANELVVVFDADMQAKPNFFLKILEVMLDDGTALCLTPQAFSNVNFATDILNNSNAQFWEYILPGCDALGYIACTGTNFCIRARALGSVGWFPTYCITEDYALSMELKAAGYRGRYLADYLAVGEAPEELRNVLRQRSRWTKGHMQVFFSSKNPLLRWKLPWHQKLLYNNGTWSYFVCIITTWTFILVPFFSLMFELQPVRFSRQFALAATLYLGTTSAVQNYFHVADHLRGIWFANVSNYLLSWTYAKAIWNVLLSKVHIKQKAGFKATEKTGAGAASAAAAAPPAEGFAQTTSQIQNFMLTRMTSLTRRFNGAQVPHLYEQPLPMAPGTGKEQKEDETISEKLFFWVCLSICSHTLVLGLHQVFVLRAFTAWLALPCLWALYNAVPPILFFGFIFGSTRFMEILCFWAQVVQTLAGLGAVIVLWFIPSDVYTPPQ